MERARVKRGGNPRDKLHGESAAVGELEGSSQCGAEPLACSLLYPHCRKSPMVEE